MIDRGSQGGRIRTARPVLPVVAVLAVAASILGLGLFGPHSPSPRASSTSAVLGRTARPMSPAAIDGSSPPAVLPPPEAAQQSMGDAASSPRPSGPATQLGDIRTILPPSGALASAELPQRLAGRAMAAIGTRLFYELVDGGIGSTRIGVPGSDEVVLTLPPCQTASQMAAAGHVLAYVVTQPVGSSGGAFGCGGDSIVAWSLWLLDLDSGVRREVASGGAMPSFVDQYDFPVHISLSETGYAFDLPTGAFDFAGHNLNDPDAIEVHWLDGGLRWISPVGQRIISVMLAGSRLAVLTASGDGAAARDALWIADATRAQPALVSEPASVAAISADGRYLAWDLPAAVIDSPAVSGIPAGQSAIRVQSLGSDGIATVDPSGAVSPQTLHAAVASTPRGPIAAWLARSTSGDSYVAFRRSWQTGVRAVSAGGSATWLAIQGDTLVWAVADAQGNPSRAFALDLSKLPT